MKQPKPTTAVKKTSKPVSAPKPMTKPSSAGKQMPKLGGPAAEKKLIKQYGLNQKKTK